MKYVMQSLTLYLLQMHSNNNEHGHYIVSWSPSAGQNITKIHQNAVQQQWSEEETQKEVPIKILSYRFLSLYRVLKRIRISNKIL